MKIFLPAVTLLFPLLSFSQITITNADFADGGDLTYVSTANDPAIDFSTTGINQTWDFSTLVSTGQIIRDYQPTSAASFLAQVSFGNFAPADYNATNFLPSDALPLDQISGVLPVTISDVNQFSKHSADSITSVGMSVVINGTEAPFKADTIETRYKFPLNINDTYSSRGYQKLDMNPIYNGIWIQYRQRNSTVDGWGSITTPYGTFDVLRIDHLITERDSLIFEVQGFPIAIELPIPDSHEYEWITVGEKEPILRIITSVTNGTETVSNIEYKDQNLTASLGDLENRLEIFPNPSSDVIKIKDLEEPSTYSVYSSNGKMTLEGKVSPTKNTIDISKLEKGTYTIVLISGVTSLINSFVKN
ncbi:MAG TPA: T9SS type A sorting domain-containing protein [Crocinitomicaceae bacterium]|nr:T9SS type A sorting domain-containing protein [Crocinitomicaceae bacterium]